MTRSDKDFIARIQVSQLVTDDPVGDDFYAQLLSTFQRSRMGTGENDTAVVQFGPYGGIGVGLPLGHKGAGRKDNALNRMATQVERIVKNQKNRESQPQGMWPPNAFFDAKWIYKFAFFKLICRGHLGKSQGGATKLHPARFCKSMEQLRRTPTNHLRMGKVPRRRQQDKAEMRLLMPQGYALTAVTMRSSLTFCLDSACSERAVHPV